MIPRATYLHGEDESDYKQLTMDAWVYFTLKHWSNQRNGTMSKSVLTYEVLASTVDAEFDMLDAYEQDLDSHLEQYGYDGVDDLREISEDEARSQLREDAEEWMAESEYTLDDRMRDVKVWVPDSMESSVPWARGWGNQIEDALVSLRASPWSDRTSRIETKRQLLKYEEKDVEPTDRVAKAIISGSLGGFENIDVVSDTVQSLAEYKARADEFGSWSDGERYERLYEVYQHERPDQDEMVEAIQSAHGIDTTWHVENKVDKFAEKFEVYDYAPVDELDVTEDNFVQLVEYHGDTPENRARLTNSLLEWYELEQEQEKISLTYISELLYESDIIRKDDRHLALKALERMNDDIGLAAYQKTQKGFVYLSSHIPGLDEDEEEPEVVESVVEQANKIIDETEKDISVVAMSADRYSEVEDESIRVELLERCCIGEWDGGYNVYVDDVEEALDRAGWTIPDEYESVRDWISSFSVVSEVDSDGTVVPVPKYQ